MSDALIEDILTWACAVALVAFFGCWVFRACKEMLSR